MIALALALALAAAPPTTATVAVYRLELEQLRARAAAAGHTRKALEVCLEDVGDLEAVHRADLATVRTLTSTRAESPVLRVLAVGGLALGAVGGMCAAETDEQRAPELDGVCTYVGLGAAILGVVAEVVDLLTAP